MSWPALTTVVERGDPFHWTTAPAAKPLPVTVSVKAALPAVAELGFKFAIAGAGLIVNTELLEVTPPEIAVMPTAPGLPINAAETVAVN